MEHWFVLEVIDTLLSFAGRSQPTAKIEALGNATVLGQCTAFSVKYPN